MNVRQELLHHGHPQLMQIVEANRNGTARGIYSVCSANETVLQAAIEQAQEDASPVLIEATCNQVNQEGGYTGMRPRDFYRHVSGLAERAGFDTHRLIFGGDHLGPNPWRKLPAAQAMEAARILVADYARAGFAKLHLDASMACQGDPAALPVEVIAERAADLCAVAESAWRDNAVAMAPLYVIGTEVPVPGGATAEGGQSHAIEVTRSSDLAETIETHRRVFHARGLQSAWERVIAVVAQPGVEFDNASVHIYQPDAARALSQSILAFDGLVFEAHSTDYQPEAALANLVADHFAVLKVGPGLTFALREAVFALSFIEEQCVPAEDQSTIRQILERSMLEAPANWADYYHGDTQAKKLARQYSYSDRIRYYWPDPTITSALERLFQNLTVHRPAETLLSQFMPTVYEAAQRANRMATADPRAWVRQHIKHVLATYARACGLRHADSSSPCFI